MTFRQSLKVIPSADLWEARAARFALVQKSLKKLKNVLGLYSEDS